MGGHLTCIRRTGGGIAGGQHTVNMVCDPANLVAEGNEAGPDGYRPRIAGKVCSKPCKVRPWYRAKPRHSGFSGKRSLTDIVP